MYLQTVAACAKRALDGSGPSVRGEQRPRKSPARIGRTFIDSGSANRTLYSRSFGPSRVFMKPPYRIPLNGVPREAIAARVLRIVSRACSYSPRVTNGRRWSASLYDPLQPRLGPLSPSYARLW